MISDILLLSIIIIYLVGHIFALLLANYIAVVVSEFLGNLTRYKDGIIFKFTSSISNVLKLVYTSAGRYRYSLYLIMVPFMNILIFIYVCYLLIKIKVLNESS